MTGEILFLAHRLPFPPDRGDRIRSHHIVKALARIAPVHVGCFVDSDADLAHTPELAQIAASYCVAKRSKPLAWAGMEALWRHQPVSLTAFGSKQLSAWVRSLLESGKIGAIYVFSGQMGQFVPVEWAGRLVVDLVDVDSAKFEAYSHETRFPHSWINAREGRLLAQVESALATRADRTLLVSEAEVQMLRDRSGSAGTISAMGNGIDADFFAPEGIVPHPDMAPNGPHFVYTGQMDYPPNVSAVKRMAQAILPLIRQEYPNAQFHIVGRAPTGEVLALASQAGCHVHGEVPDMRPFLAAADVVIAPLTIARGVQNKVLEAMAMARPVLLSPHAATGIDARDGEHFLIAGDDKAFVQAALRLIGNRQAAQALGLAARKFVIENQSWPAMLADLPHYLGLTNSPPESRDAA